MDSELQAITDKVGQRKHCELCGRRMPKGTRQFTVWCKVCTARHKMVGPCPNCNGAFHFPGVGTDVATADIWVGFGNVIGEAVNSVLQPELPFVTPPEQGTLFDAG